LFDVPYGNPAARRCIATVFVHVPHGMLQFSISDDSDKQKKSGRGQNKNPPSAAALVTSPAGFKFTTFYIIPAHSFERKGGTNLWRTRPSSFSDAFSVKKGGQHKLNLHLKV
jgi:hypothetical protein